MEHNTNLSSTYLCRACMTESDETRSLFTKKNGENRTLSDVYYFLTNIQIIPDNNYPKHICKACEVLLHQLDEFKRRCLQNEAKLQGFSHDSVHKLEETFIKNEIQLRPYQCSICHLQYSDINDLQYHVQNNHVQKADINMEPINKCNDIKQEMIPDFIEETFTDNDTYMLNSVEDCKTNEFCDTIIATVEKLEARKSLKVTQFHCEPCKRYYKNQHSLRKHIRVKHERRKSVKQIVKPVKFDKHQCDHCLQMFVKKTTLVKHLRNHEEKQPFICELCKRVFAYKAFLDNHILSVHTTEDGYKCSVCDSRFPTAEMLKIHRTSHDSEKKHQCNFCSKFFVTLSSLRDHRRVHTGERPFLCPTCGKGFTQSTNLKEHMRRHAGIKPFNCSVCDKSFVSKGTLESHLRKHSGARPYICPECGSSFTASNSLAKHIRTHTGERPYACEMCPMRFTASDKLKVHRRTHTGEKPYKCSHCDKAFAQKHDMTKHTRCHTGERPYVCPVCGQAFRQGSALKTHLKMHPMIQDSGRHLELQ